MIAVVGSSHDDILYFETIMSNKKKEMIFNRFEVTIGTIFNQEVLLMDGLYTSVLTSSLINYILGRHYISLVINVGKCISVSKGFKAGDIVISSRVIDVNVDLTKVQNVELGQIPGFKRVFEVQNDIITYTRAGLSKRTYATAKNSTFLSSDNLSEQTLEKIQTNKAIFGENSNLVIDSVSAGIALACNLYDVPFIIVKAIERPMEKDADIETYLQVLDSYINLGKAVVSTIGDIGRTDILTGGF